MSILLFGGRQPDSPWAETGRMCAEGVREVSQSKEGPGGPREGREGVTGVSPALGGMAGGSRGVRSATLP